MAARFLAHRPSPARADRHAKRAARAALTVLCARRNQLSSRHAPTDASVPPPSCDYSQLLGRRRRGDGSSSSAATDGSGACPALLLAPMENLADRHFRTAHVAAVGGFDEACTEFIRIPAKAENVRRAVLGVTRGYDARELSPVPLGAQIMGSVPHMLAKAARHLAAEKHAPRIDLNCGCPSNAVTGNGAGSSLLRQPERLYAAVRAMVDAVAGLGVPVSVKVRAGYNDTSLLEDNLLAVQEAGAAFVTLHPRTKVQGYNGRADWSLIAAARRLLRIPVVGNGDIVSLAAAREVLQLTGCDGLMIGRGAVQDPLIFHRIRASFAAPDLPWGWEEAEAVQAFLRYYDRSICGGHTAEVAAAAAGSSAAGAEGGAGEGSGVGCGAGHATGGAVSVEQGGCAASSEFAASHYDSSSSSSGSGSGAGGGGTMGGAQQTPGSLYSQERTRLNCLKKVVRYLFSTNPVLEQASEELLRVQVQHMGGDEYLDHICRLVGRHWSPGGPLQHALVGHRGSITQLCAQPVAPPLAPQAPLVVNAPA